MDEVKTLKTKYLNFLVATKAKEVHFKILNRVYPENFWDVGRFGLDVNNCSFCDDQIETTEHLFYVCKFACAFWEDLH